MTVYDVGIPVEPPVGTKVEDKEGDTWTRVGTYWQLGNDACNTDSWEYLVRRYGPLRLVEPTLEEKLMRVIEALERYGLSDTVYARATASNLRGLL